MAVGRLQSARQELAQQSPIGTVPVRLTQRGDSLIVDLFVETLYPDETVRQARLMLPASDSLVVEIEGQKIAIRLPAGFTAR